ncbi:hypothetical protein DIE04_05120 [Burkholderia sp. Bp8994]|nr:hypothetical protein DIE20_07310 [Burkholderia sp. Bp9131]RQR69628.1 hypothetical protein DIE12_22805 [Burkholderia sp. Bp9015]RQR78277.1 hypothetical protein DIE10_23965 [Burkholderia sp. Bp9011]RQR88514.1 hypothetical protein DIE09_26055 [Burkholderia sp. Bp9010]RQS00408.1 hypothetical protein DIE04_05120 [Burkholderia sp. Bp8994]RQS02471.1 hypothetical protein DIE02_23030 [Burkholderia sp. Bp8991]RQS34142.1 hypothetical protein DIE05_02745 [Burkholderia sp. Bp8995]RQS44006.1 hypothetic
MSSATQSIPPSGSGGGIFFVPLHRWAGRLPGTDEKKRMCSFAHAFDRGLRRVLRMLVSA